MPDAGMLGGCSGQVKQLLGLDPDQLSARRIALTATYTQADGRSYHGVMHPTLRIEQKKKQLVDSEKENISTGFWSRGPDWSFAQVLECKPRAMAAGSNDPADQAHPHPVPPSGRAATLSILPSIDRRSVP